MVRAMPRAATGNRRRSGTATAAAPSRAIPAAPSGPRACWRCPTAAAVPPICTSATTAKRADGRTLARPPGRLLATRGPSGSGKATLPQSMAGLATATAGRTCIAGRDLAERSDDELTALRREQIGFVFQAFNLVPTLTAGENI